MLQNLVANWLRQQAKDAILGGLRPDAQSQSEAPSETRPQSDEDTPSGLVDIACFFPSQKEATGLVDLLSAKTSTHCNGFVEHLGAIQSKSVAVIEAPLAHEKLAVVVHDVVRLRKPSWVFASGFAAAISPDIKRGHLLVANRLVDAEDYSLAIDTKMSEAKGLHVGTLLTSVEDQDVSNSRAVAQDYQAAVVGEVCRVLKARMMAVHCVTSQAGAKNKNPVADKIKSQESIAGFLGAAAGALIDQPSSVKRMLEGKGENLVFTDRLAKFLSGIIAQLPVSK